MRFSKVGGVIAAASRRVARPMLEIGDIPIIQRIVNTYRQSGIFPIVVITGADEDDVRHQLSNYGVIFLNIDNDEMPELFESVKAGLGYLKGKCERVVFTPVNVPLFTPVTLERLLQNKGDAIVPEYEGKAGHPVVIDEENIGPILSYKGDEGLWGAMKQDGINLVRIPVNDMGVALGIKSREEMEKQLKKFNSVAMHSIVKVQLEKEMPFFSERHKVLLFLLAETGNMRKACDASGIAYSNAWEMIKQLEYNLGFSVVERNRGGRSGGSTTLTEKGGVFLRKYQEFDTRIHRYASMEFDSELNPLLESLSERGAR